MFCFSYTDRERHAATHYPTKQYKCPACGELQETSQQVYFSVFVGKYCTNFKRSIYVLLFELFIISLFQSRYSKLNRLVMIAYCARNKYINAIFVQAILHISSSKHGVPIDLKNTDPHVGIEGYKCPACDFKNKIREKVGINLFFKLRKFP